MSEMFLDILLPKNDDDSNCDDDDDNNEDDQCTQRMEAACGHL